MSEQNCDELPVQSNLYRVNFNPIDLYWFEFKLKPMVSYYECRRRIIKRFSSINRAQLGECSFVHDDVFYVTRPLKSFQLKTSVPYEGETYEVLITCKSVAVNVDEWQRSNFFDFLIHLWTKHYRRFGKKSIPLFYDPENVLVSLPGRKSIVPGFTVDFEKKESVLQITAKAYCCDSKGRWLNHQSLSKSDYDIYMTQCAIVNDSFFRLITTVIEKLPVGTLSKFGIKLDPISVSGKVLPRPTLLPSDPEGPFYKVPKGPIKWAVFLFDQRVPENDLDKFTQLFTTRARQHGLDLDECLSTRILPVESVDQIKNLFACLHEQDVKFVLIGAPFDDKFLEFNSTFLSIKYNANKTYKLTNQFFISTELPDFLDTDKSPKKIDTLLIKINIKIGGQVNIIDPVYLKQSWHDPSQTMLIGGMVSFPHPGVQSRQVNAVLVGSMDCSYAKHETIVTSNNRNSEINQLESMLTEMLNKYNDANQRYPQSLLFFRQSSSYKKNDNPFTYKNELITVKKVMKKLMPSGEMVYIVARNAYDLRFGLKQSTQNAHSILPSGTLIDHFSDSSHLDTFYLCINYGIEHASRPVIYQVYENTSSMSKGQLRQLCFDLCHFYNRQFSATRFPVALEKAANQATKARHRFEGQLLLDQADSLSEDTVQQLLDGFNQFSISSNSST